MVLMRMSGEARREQLLDATKAIVLERGFHAVSIEGVARAAGITRPIVYGHFTDLPGLLEALVARESARALRQLEAALPELGQDVLLDALGAYLDAVRADPDTWRLVLMPQEGAPGTLHANIARGRAAIVGRLTTALAPRLNGELADPELTAHMISAYADEAARLTLTDSNRYTSERILALTRWALERLAL